MANFTNKMKEYERIAKREEDNEPPINLIPFGVVVLAFLFLLIYLGL